MTRTYINTHARAAHICSLVAGKFRRRRARTRPSRRTSCSSRPPPRWVGVDPRFMIAGACEPPHMPSRTRLPPPKPAFPRLTHTPRPSQPTPQPKSRRASTSSRSSASWPRPSPAWSRRRARGMPISSTSSSRRPPRLPRSRPTQDHGAPADWAPPRVMGASGAGRIVTRTISVGRTGPARPFFGGLVKPVPQCACRQQRPVPRPK